MIGCAWRNLMSIHIVRAYKVFMTMYFLHNGCTFNRKGRVRKGVPKTLKFVTLFVLKESTYDSRMMFIYLQIRGRFSYAGTEYTVIYRLY